MEPEIFTTIEPRDIRTDDAVRITQAGPQHNIVITGKVKRCVVDGDFPYVELHTGGAWSLDTSVDAGVNIIIERKTSLPLIDGAVILVDGEPYIYRTRRAEQGMTAWEGPQKFISSREAVETGFITLHTPKEA